MSNARKLYTLLLLIPLLGGCGRKRGSIFTFSENKTVTANSFDLPVIRQFEANHDKTSVLLQWKPLHYKNIEELAERALTFMGYNVYRLTKKGFIPKKPINKDLIQGSHWCDEKPFQGENFYLVKSVFMNQGQQIESLSSKMVKVSF